MRIEIALCAAIALLFSAVAGWQGGLVLFFTLLALNLVTSDNPHSPWSITRRDLDNPLQPGRPPWWRKS